MANSTFNGVNATKSAKAIPDLNIQGELGGRVKSMYDTYVLLADLASGDIINLGSPLPEGARLIDVQITTGALGGSCTLDVGWAASADGSEAVNATGIFSALPVSSATVANAHGNTYEGTFWQKVFAGACQLQVKEHAVSSGATGLAISIEVKYVID